jgi:hypothetical protein
MCKKFKREKIQFFSKLQVILSTSPSSKTLIKKVAFFHVGETAVLNINFPISNWDLLWTER